MPSIDGMTDLRIRVLDTGLTVATEVVPGARSSAAGVWVGVGSRDEPAVNAGVSHFLEHLLFKGTATRTAQQISRAVDARGGDVNAFTGREYTAYYSRLPARHMGEGLELLGDIVSSPALRVDDLEAERLVILEELAMDDDVPDDVALREFSARLFADHSLGRDPAGDRAHVSAMRVDDVRAFFERHYGAETMVVAVAGPQSHDEMLRAATSAFAGVRRGVQRPVRVAPSDPASGTSIDDDSEQVHLVVGGRALHRRDPRREALDVVNHVLGGGLSSRLFEEIRERRGLAYSVYSTVSAYEDAGAFHMYAGTHPDRADLVEQLLCDELERVRVEGITDAELELARGALVGSFELGLEDTGARMSRTGALLVTLGDVRPPEEQASRWAAVGHDEVAEVAAEALPATPLVVRVGPTAGGGRAHRRR